MTSAASRVAAVPYDVVTVEEARAQSAGNPLSFLHVSRAEIGLPGVDVYDGKVYETAATNFGKLKQAAPLVVEDAPSLYLYRLRMGGHEQTGIAAAFTHFGGVPRTILGDNARALVLGRDRATGTVVLWRGGTSAAACSSPPTNS